MVKVIRWLTGNGQRSVSDVKIGRLQLIYYFMSPMK